MFDRESNVCFQPLFVARRARRAAVTGPGAGGSGTFTVRSDVGVSFSTPTVGAWVWGLSVCKQRTSYRKVMVSRSVARKPDYQAAPQRGTCWWSKSPGALLTLTTMVPLGYDEVYLKLK